MQLCLQPGARLTSLTQISLNNSPIPVKFKVKVLVVTFDSMLNFGEHARSTKEKLQKRNNLVIEDGAADLKSYRAEHPELRCYIFSFHNQQYKQEAPTSTIKHCSQLLVV